MIVNVEAGVEDGDIIDIPAGLDIRIQPTDQLA